MNLGETYLGLGVSGIAGFCDHQINEVLGMPVDQAVLSISQLWGVPKLVISRRC
jgi:hypothetical protein